MLKNILMIALLAALLAGCSSKPATPDTQPDSVPQASETNPTVKTGWVEENGQKYYCLSDGSRATAWQDIDGSRYYFASDGSLVTGWMGIGESMYFFGSDGVMQTGWVEDQGKHYHLDSKGILQTGWLELGGKKYYLGKDGARQTGWLSQDGVRYYLRSDGTMARGKVKIDGKDRYFTSSGAEIILANPWNTIPGDYRPEVKQLSTSVSVKGKEASVICIDQLTKMVNDCNKVCPTACVISAYRSHAYQTKNFNRKVKFYLDKGYSEEKAKIEAAKVVAVPGTSEHELGLAFDIIDTRHWDLTEVQEGLPAQKWLTENCWKYGFILRYPKGRTDSTGIIYEPWHYRYVGLDVAKEIHESGQTLEEYLLSLH